MIDFSQQTQIKPGQIIEIVFRHKWLIIFLLSGLLTLGLLRTLTIDRMYQASTTILVQPQGVPSNYVRSVVSTGIEERVSSISQQIMSVTNLERLINQFDLYKDEKDMYLEDKIKNIRKRIDVDIIRSRERRGSALFTIQYTGNQPDQVMEITNTIASYFMDVNLKIREKQVVGTSDFLDEELEKIKSKLEVKEKELAQYRSEHVGELPSELESNLRTLDRLQTQLTNNQVALREARNTEITLQQQIIVQKEISARSTGQVQNGTGNENRRSGPTTDRNELNRLKGELSDLLLKYTEKHPDVIKLQKTIRKLEKKVEESKEIRISDGEISLNADPEIMELELQHKRVENSIAGLTTDIQSIKNRMRHYEKLVEQTPRREQELQKFTRDYAGIQNVYNSLLNRRLEAGLSVNMEEKQQGDLFRVLDYARRPEKPISPKVIIALLISLGAPCALAGGIIYLLFIFDNTVRRKEDIVDTFKLPILVAIGAIKKPENVFREKMNALSLIIASSYIIAIIGVFVALELYGIDRSINLIKSYINF